MSLKLHNFGNFCMIQKVMRIKHGHVQNRKTFLFHSLVCHKQSLHKTITLKKLIHNSQFFLGFKIFFFLLMFSFRLKNKLCMSIRASGILEFSFNRFFVIPLLLLLLWKIFSAHPTSEQTDKRT